MSTGQERAEDRPLSLHAPVDDLGWAGVELNDREQGQQGAIDDQDKEQPAERGLRGDGIAHQGKDQHHGQEPKQLPAGRAGVHRKRIARDPGWRVRGWRCGNLFVFLWEKFLVKPGRCRRQECQGGVRKGNQLPDAKPEKSSQTQHHGALDPGEAPDQQDLHAPQGQQDRQTQVQPVLEDRLAGCKTPGGKEDKGAEDNFDTPPDEWECHFSCRKPDWTSSLAGTGRARCHSTTRT